MSMYKKSAACLFLSTPLLFTACGSSDSNKQEITTQKLTVNLTDAPIDDASNVWVSIKGVSLNYQDEGWVDYDLDSVQKVDLLTLQSGKTMPLLDGVDVKAGEYKIRLNLHDDPETDLEHAIKLSEGGAEFGLTIPSGNQTGLKITTPLVVLATGSADYTIDFDVRKSIVKRGKADNYALKPTLKLINNQESGSITGTFTDATLFSTNCSDNDPLTHNAVYVYSGHDAVADDIYPEVTQEEFLEGTKTQEIVQTKIASVEAAVTEAATETVTTKGVQPVTSSPVTYNAETGEYSYKVAFLPVGDYTVSLTCNADLENIETNDELSFKASANKTVSATTDAATDSSETQDDTETQTEKEDNAEAQPEVIEKAKEGVA